MTIEMEYKGLSSGGSRREPTRGLESIEGQIGYGTKYGETRSTST